MPTPSDSANIAGMARGVHLWIGEGNVLYKLDRYEEALRLYDEALSILQGDRDLIFYREDVLYSLDLRRR